MAGMANETLRKKKGRSFPKKTIDDRNCSSIRLVSTFIVTVVFLFLLTDFYRRLRRSDGIRNLPPSIHPRPQKHQGMLPYLENGRNEEDGEQDCEKDLKKLEENRYFKYLRWKNGRKSFQKRWSPSPPATPTPPWKQCSNFTADNFLMKPLNVIPDQEFQYFVVIDFEATCNEHSKIDPQEIIEFPSIIVSAATGNFEYSFQTYVRPACHPQLTDFCTKLTGIQQIHVDRGVSLNEALCKHDRWLVQKGVRYAKFAIVTWTDNDCGVMLESECTLKNIEKPDYFNRWINLEVPFNEVFPAPCKLSLKKAVEIAGLRWKGRQHCGLDDAENTALLLSNLIHRGCRFKITTSLDSNARHSENFN